MILLLSLAWFFLSVGIFLCLIPAAYYAYVRDAPRTKLAAKFIGAIAVHTAVVIPGAFIAGIYMIAQAHSEGVVKVEGRELIIASLVLGFEAVVGWLLCSAVVGRLIGKKDPI